MELTDVDGVLVGGASLTVESFNKIIHYSSVGRLNEIQYRTTQGTRIKV